MRGRGSSTWSRCHVVVMGRSINGSSPKNIVLGAYFIFLGINSLPRKNIDYNAIDLELATRVWMGENVNDFFTILQRWKTRTFHSLHFDFFNSIKIGMETSAEGYILPTSIVEVEAVLQCFN